MSDTFDLDDETPAREKEKERPVRGEAGRLAMFLHGLSEGRLEDRLDTTLFEDPALMAVAEEANAAAAPGLARTSRKRASGSSS